MPSRRARGEIEQADGAEENESRGSAAFARGQSHGSYGARKHMGGEAAMNTTSRARFPVVPR